MDAPFEKGLTIGFLLLFQIPNLIAEEAIELRRDTITVRVWDRVQIDAGTLDRAKQVAASVFQPVGLEIRWVDCLTGPTPENQRCISPAGPNDFSVRIFWRPAKSRQQLRRHTAGVAVPSQANGGSGFIQIFFDRLQEISRDNRGAAPLELLLGITIAHEIGHLLLPDDGHSISGIMQGWLGRRSLDLAAQGRMVFTPEQKMAIGKNVREWSKVSESKQLAVTTSRSESLMN